jgi:hypothetical protein
MLQRCGTKPSPRTGGLLKHEFRALEGQIREPLALPFEDNGEPNHADVEAQRDLKVGDIELRDHGRGRKLRFSHGRETRGTAVCVREGWRPFRNDAAGWSGYVRPMGKVSSRLVVGAFAGTRVAIGVAFAVAPDRLGARSDRMRTDTLMTRSFAVREVVLGIGGLVAVARADRHPSAVRTWAGLGALTDAGDLAASLAGRPRRNQAARIPALVAAMGLAAELWAFAAPVQA